MSKMAIDQTKLQYMNILPIPVPKVVLDGGPCSGKSTVLAKISEVLTERGWLVITLPEIATEMKLAGLWFGDEQMEPEIFQRLLMRYMKMKEDIWVEMASHMRHKNPNKVVIICDRAMMTSKAYLENDELFYELLSEIGLNEISARDERYKAVILMDVAPKEFYTLENNNARHESHADAERRHELIVNKSWTGHPHVRRAGNHGGWDKKVKTAIGYVCDSLGEPIPLETERKFLIERPSDELLQKMFAVELKIKQTYLNSIHEEERVRQRGNGVNNIYIQTIKKYVEDGVYLETEALINGATYRKLLINADPTRRPIEKNRSCLLDTIPHQLYYWEIDRFVTPNIIVKPTEALMELECHSLTEDLTFPEGISVIKEVTGDPLYKNANMAKI